MTEKAEDLRAMIKLAEEKLTRRELEIDTKMAKMRKANALHELRVKKLYLLTQLFFYETAALHVKSTSPEYTTASNEISKIKSQLELLKNIAV